MGDNYKERNEDTYQEQINVNLWKSFKENMIQDVIETTLKMSGVWTLSPLVNKYLCKKIGPLPNAKTIKVSSKKFTAYNWVDLTHFRLSMFQPFSRVNI